MKRSSCFGLLLLLPAAGFGAPSDLLISEVYEGTAGNLKYVEVYNNGPTTVDFAATPVSIRRFSDGGTVFVSLPLVGAIAPSEFFVIANNINPGEFQGVFGFPPDQESTVIFHNGNDSYDLFDDTAAAIIDGFAKDQVTGTTAPSFCPDRVAFRVRTALPNNGDWGQTTPPADTTTTANGFWVVRTITAGNGNATAVATPGTSGGAGGTEVPVTLSSFSLQ